MATAAGALAISAPAGALAQTALEEIVVTAQKREERLQDVPISITAVTAQAVEARGISGTQDLQQLATGLNVGQLGNVNPVIYLRGVGTQNASPGEEPSVSVYVDGVYISAAPATIFSLNNISRIEVLRGPQGTLFGRNATGGLVHIITRDPVHETSGEASVGYGNYQSVEAKFYGTTGIAENLAADLALYYYDRDKGFGHNLRSGRRVGVDRQFGARSKALWTPTDDTRITAAVDFWDQRGDMGQLRAPGPGVTATDGATKHPSNLFDVNNNVEAWEWMTRFSASLKGEQELGFGRLVSISAYQRTKVKGALDLDGTPLDLIETFIQPVATAFTQEIQIQAPAESAIQWVAGGFFLDSQAMLGHFNDPAAGNIVKGLGAGPTRLTVRHGKIATTSYSAFAQATGNLTEALRLTGGLRYTHDKKKYDGYQTNGLATILSRSDQMSNSKLTYRAAIDYKLNPDAMLFATYNRGFKSGTFNLNNVTNPAVRPETLDAFEGGLKSELFDNRVRLNLSGYWYKYRDIQLQQSVGNTTFVTNAARARLRGVELEFEARASESLTLNGAIGLTDGKYQNFPNAPATFPEPFTCALNGPGPTDPAFGNQACVRDATGKDTIRTPPVTANLAATYSTPMAGGSLELTGSIYHNGGFYFEPDNRVKQKAYQVVNAQVRWVAPNEKLSLKAWARNLFDEDYYVMFSGSVHDQFGAAEPATYGVAVQYRF